MTEKRKRKRRDKTRQERREKRRDKKEDERQETRQTKRRQDEEERREDQEGYDVLCVWLCGFDFSCLFKISRPSNNFEFSKLP